MSPDEIKKHIIADLSLEALSPEQQDRIITELSEAILERITIAAMAKVPDSPQQRSLRRTGRPTRVVATRVLLCTFMGSWQGAW